MAEFRRTSPWAWIAASFGLLLCGFFLFGGPTRESIPGSAWLAPVAEAQGPEPAYDSRSGLTFEARDGGVFIGSAGLGQSTSLDVFAVQRRQMVSRQIKRRGIRQKRVLEAMYSVPRHEFVPREFRARAYEDRPVPIDEETSIAQPYIVALMTECLELDGDEKVLEIGTGSGYHSAVLSQVARKVYTIEINEKLSERARRTLARLGYTSIETRQGDGYQGWPEEAPFDAIILTAAPRRIPEPLIEQLKVGGKMVVPLGGFLQDLMVLTKEEDGVTRKPVAPVRLPEMTGEVQEK